MVRPFQNTNGRNIDKCIILQFRVYHTTNDCHFSGSGENGELKQTHESHVLHAHEYSAHRHGVCVCAVIKCKTQSGTIDQPRAFAMLYSVVCYA